MKKILAISALIFFAMSCNMNPSKETRITNLETEIQVVKEVVTTLEYKVQQLSIENEQQKMKIDSLTTQWNIND